MPPTEKHTDSEMMRFAVGEALVEALPRALKESLPNALKDTARDPEMWAAANEGMQEHVSNKAGGWLMKMVWMAISRGLLFLVLGSIMYAAGGWSLVAKVFFGGTK